MLNIYKFAINQVKPAEKLKLMIMNTMDHLISLVNLIFINFFKGVT